MKSRASQVTNERCRLYFESGVSLRCRQDLHRPWVRIAIILPLLLLVSALRPSNLRLPRWEIERECLKISAPSNISKIDVSLSSVIPYKDPPGAGRSAKCLYLWKRKLASLEASNRCCACIKRAGPLDTAVAHRPISPQPSAYGAALASHRRYAKPHAHGPQGSQRRAGDGSESTPARRT